jgi:hypothetical protein
MRMSLIPSIVREEATAVEAAISRRALNASRLK